MKREIKFRAWDGKEMHYGVVPWRWDFCISLNWHKCERSSGTGILGSGGSDGDFLVPGIRVKKLMQFTGLKDKNGKEIYEGDIFGSELLRCFVIIQPNGAYELEFVNKKIKNISILDHKISQSAVIGNIYENPELLTP